MIQENTRFHFPVFAPTVADSRKNMYNRLTFELEEAYQSGAPFEVRFTRATSALIPSVKPREAASPTPVTDPSKVPAGTNTEDHFENGCGVVLDAKPATDSCSGCYWDGSVGSGCNRPLSLLDVCPCGKSYRKDGLTKIWVLDTKKHAPKPALPKPPNKLVRNEDVYTLDNGTVLVPVKGRGDCYGCYFKTTTGDGCSMSVCDRKKSSCFTWERKDNRTGLIWVAKATNNPAVKPTPVRTKQPKDTEYVRYLGDGKVLRATECSKMHVCQGCHYRDMYCSDVKCKPSQRGDQEHCMWKLTTLNWKTPGFKPLKVKTIAKD